MALVLLTLPDEILHQICEEILGGDATLSKPITPGYHSSIVGVASYPIMDKRELPVFYSCRKLQTILLEILCRKQAYQLYVYPVGIIGDNGLIKQNNFLRYHSYHIQNINIKVSLYTTLINDFLTARHSGFRERSLRHRTRDLTNREVIATCVTDLARLLDILLKKRSIDITQLFITVTGGYNSFYHFLLEENNLVENELGSYELWNAGDNEYWKPKLERVIRILLQPLQVLKGTVSEVHGRFLFDNDIKKQGAWLDEIVRDLVMA